MSKGSRIIPVRIGGELLAEIQETIERRNQLTREMPWDMSAFVRAAIGDKLRHLRRAAEQARRRRKMASAEGE